MLFLRLKLTKPDKRCKRFRASGLCNIRGVTLIENNSSAIVAVAKRSNARELCTCQHCGIVFKPKSTDRVTFCSRECAFHSKAKVEYSSIYAGYCNGCGGAFVSRRKRAYCCADCVPSNIREYVSTAPEVKICRCCGKEYKPKGATRPEDYCSKTCKHKSYKKQRGISNAKRRARMRGVDSELVDPFKVFDRDGWRCQLCGVKTPKSKRGTYAENAPELDHIIPLSKGGSHKYTNTQCACRKCNQDKSDTPLGQMLLFG